MELEIGAKVKNLRNKKGLSIAQLSEKSEVSTGLISQIERDKVVPSVTSLFRLSNALETDISYFFKDSPKKDCLLIRSGDHRVFSTKKDASVYQLLSSTSQERLLDMVVITLDSNEVQEKESITHEGEECGYVLEGVLTIILNGTEYTLFKGDSITFSSKLPHKYINRNKEKCVSIWAMAPCFF